MDFRAFEMAGFCVVRGLGKGNFGATCPRKFFFKSMEHFNIINM